MKYLISVLLLFSSVTANAGDTEIPFPTCVIDNRPVTYQSIRTSRVNAYNGQEFVAEADHRGVKKIIYNRSVLITHPKEWRMQVMLHECGHLELRHEYDQDYSKEYDADCYSAKRLQTEFKYTDEQFTIITNTMRKVKLPESRISVFNSCLNR